MRVLSTLAGGLRDLLWPLTCAACEALLPGAAPLCRRCAETLVESRSGRQQPSFTPPTPFPETHAAFEYGGQLALAIVRAKYGPDGAAARRLGRLLAPLPTADLVIPVPLHPRRLRRRGFNQAAELARGAGARVEVGVLERIRDTPPQTGRPRAARLRNVTGAFAVPPRARPRLFGRRVLLVDDVLTTGATVWACAETLAGAGAAAIRVATLARSTP
jgi:ComF family protein